MLGAKKQPALKEGLQYDPAQVETLSAVERGYVQKALEWQGEGFDTRVSIVEPRSGTLLVYQPYRRVVNQDGVTYYRKDESGVERRYNEHGQSLDKPAVRNVDTKLSK